jgi:hypothetical protein
MIANNSSMILKTSKGVYLEFGKRWKIIIFCMLYIEKITILFLHKECIEILQLPHGLYARRTRDVP